MAQATQKDVVDSVFALRDEWPALCGEHRGLNFEAEADWTLAACWKNDFAGKTACGNPNSVVAALRNVAYVGLSLDPAQKLAYVLPRDSAMVYDVSYMGLIHIAVSSGSILWAQAAVVHEKDTFELRGYDEAPIHKRNPFLKAEARGPVIGAYVVAKTRDGSYLTTAMGIEELNAIRDRSPAWKNKKPNQSGGPWGTDWAEMAKKSCVKQAYKYWPRSDQLDRAIHYLNTDGGQGIDLTPEDESKTRVAAWLTKVAEVATADGLRLLLPAARKEFEEAQDPDGYAAVRDAAIKRDVELKSTSAPGAHPTASKATPKPTPAPTAAPKSPEGRLMELIETAETFDELAATGEAIDKLPPDLQGEFNDAYNVRLAYLKTKFGA